METWPSVGGFQSKNKSRKSTRELQDEKKNRVLESLLSLDENESLDKIKHILSH